METLLALPAGSLMEKTNETHWLATCFIYLHALVATHPSVWADPLRHRGRISLSRWYCILPVLIR
jgi:hypothetical protein